MSKRILQKYLFTPGTAGAGTIKVPTKVALESIVLITNATKNTVIYSEFDTTLGAVSSYNSADTTTFVNTLEGVTTITLATDTSSMSSSDRLQIIVDKQELITRPWAFGTDAIERPRVAAPQSLIDADFEYGLQPTKWQTLSTIRQYPGIYEIPGTDQNVTAITSDGGNPSLITVTTSTAHGLTSGTPITVQGLNRSISTYSSAEGSALVAVTPAPTTYTFAYYAKGQVGTGTNSLYQSYITVRKGGFYSGSSLSISSMTSDGLSTSTITVVTNSNHGLLPNSPIEVAVTSAGVGHDYASGPFYVSQIVSPTSFTYTARPGVAVSTGTTLTANIYLRAESFFLHRPLDGGVILGNNSPAYGAQAIRASKKYFRYQSGKGFFFNTGTVLKSNYDIQSATATGTSVGSTITIQTDGIDHGLQNGASVTLTGLLTSGYNGNYTVSSILSSSSFTVQAIATLGNTTCTLDIQPKIYVNNWYGSSVRVGMFDDQNGIFWEWDGQQLYACVRNSVLQLAGTVAINAGSNAVVGTNTRFQDQIKAGDNIVITGMTHEVTSVTDQFNLTVSPVYRGVANSSGVRMCLVRTTRIPSSQFNLDTLDGNGPSGYTVDVGKMQMLGMQYTWYGAGFIDFMLRGPDGNFIFVHRFKNNNINNEAYMRSGNLPARYSISNDGYISTLTGTIGASDTSLTLADASRYPISGTLYVDNELISYTGKTGNTLTGLTRAATLTQFLAGSYRYGTAGAAASHTQGTGVIFVSPTASPTISHWGSAVVMDGGYDSDRGYIFNFQRTSISATTSPQTTFLIRLAPSVSNAIVGDLGSRDLLNRSQLLLNSIEVTCTAANPIIVEAILNPQNYPTPGSVSWISLTPASNGGLPSLCQICTTIPSWTSGTAALPGETVFSFVADGASTKTLDISGLKELTASPLGGTGTFPNGSDILAINCRTITGSSTAHIVLRWSEAQA